LKKKHKVDKWQLEQEREETFSLWFELISIGINPNKAADQLDLEYSEIVMDESTLPQTLA